MSSSSSYVIHVPENCDVSEFVYRALSTNDVKKRRIDTNLNSQHAVDVSMTHDGSIMVSVRDHVVTRYRGDISQIVKYELMPRLVKCT